MLSQKQGSPHLTSSKVWLKMDEAKLAPIPTSKVRKRVLESKKLRHTTLVEQSQALCNIIQAQKWRKEILMYSL